MAELGDKGPQLSVFGLNRGDAQILYNPDMRSLDVFGCAGSGEGQFLRPRGIACLGDGTVVVADTGNDRVVYLRFQGGRLVWDHVLGALGSAHGLFFAPHGVALDSQGRLFVADTGNNRIQVFDRSGAFVESFGDDPRANNAVEAPTAIAVVDVLEPYAQRPSAAIFVIDSNQSRLQKFGTRGQFLGQAVATDVGRAAVGFDSLALDYFNNVWVTDRLNDQIHKFDEHLQWVADWGSPGSGDGALDEPRGIAIYRPYGQVIVAERESAQYLWIGADIAAVRVSHQDALAQGGSLRVDYRVTERAWVDAWVEDQDRHRLAKLLDHQFQSQGSQTLHWDGRLGDQTRIQAGTYRVVFEAEAGYSSATYVKRELRESFVIPSGS
jgi:hypothetical protein